MLLTDMRKSMQCIVGTIPAAREIEIAVYCFIIGGIHVALSSLVLRKNWFLKDDFSFWVKERVLKKSSIKYLAGVGFKLPATPTCNHYQI